VARGGDVTAAVTTDNQGNWGVRVPSMNRWVTVGNAGTRRFRDRAGAEAWIQAYNSRHSGNEDDLVAQEIEPAAAPVNRNTLMPTGPGPWEVFRRSDGRSVAELGTSNRMAAEVEARSVIDQRRESPELYGVRTQQADSAQGGIIDIEPDVAQNFAPQTLTRPGQGQQTFTGNWLILDPDGQEIHRFSGVGNVQSDANRVAINWMRSNPGRMQAGVTVVPEMGEAASQYQYTSTPIPGVEEVELDIPLAQTQWEVYNRSSNQPVFVIQAANQAEAWRKGQEWVATAMQANPEVDASNFSVRPRAQSVSENITVLEQRLRRDLGESREITKLGKLDNVLEKCISMIHRGHESDPEKYGRVAACLIDNKNNHTYGINLPGPDGTRRHAERVAIDNHLKRHGRIGPNAIMVTTLSPCVHDMDERHGESCTDLLTDYGIEKCYAGWQDPTQHPVTDYPFNLQVTDDTDIFNSCRDIAASFLPGAMVEAFDQPYKTKSEKSEYGDIDMLAKLPDGTNLSIMFNREDDENDTWGVEFYRDNSQEVTGEGDAQRIFATVLAAIQKFIKKYKPQKLFFSASKEVEPGQNSESRAKLYDRLVQRYARDWGYRAFRADTGALVRYEFSRIKPAVAEGNFTRLQNKERPAMRFHEFKLTENSKVTIKRVQQLLLDLGYNLGPTGVDGVVGPYTRSAIDAHMSKAGPQGQVVPQKDKPSTIPVVPQKDKPSTIPIAPQKDKPSTIPVVPQKDKPSTTPVAPQKDKPSTTPVAPQKDKPSIMPVNGRLTSAFGNRKAPVPGITNNHPGVDIAVPTGTAVRSPIAGKVEYASMDNNACGGTIAISNGREKHRFCHCSKIDVRVGQVIQQGDVIGLTGGGARDPGRGLSTGPHLHWEKYIAGNLVDPLSNIG
jgi:pyrimidine deaminase RibD-like protein/peptidoglycan hydrolase-like protein with peptidoglycan-binding domain